MIPGQRGPKGENSSQSGKVFVAVNLTVITVMTRHAQYTLLRRGGLLKHKAIDEIKGENVGIDLE